VVLGGSSFDGLRSSAREALAESLEPDGGIPFNFAKVLSENDPEVRR
jgi:hypothetical protein